MLDNTLSQLLSEIYRLTIENKNLNDAIAERDTKVSNMSAERDKANEVMLSAVQQLAKQDAELASLRNLVLADEGTVQK